MALITTSEAARRLGVSERRVRQLISVEKKIRAQLLGGMYVIEETELSKVKVYKKVGRPPQEKKAA